ncbi:hypothetical protein BGZ76_005450 [Entomortierella beljakovae]|nr:hypothetical protein BGZ76_005450 [Entomortierella beljakovae]
MPTRVVARQLAFRQRRDDALLEDLAFATGVCNLAQTLVIHFGDTDNIGTTTQKVRILLDLPIVTRAESLRTSSGSRRKAAFTQPLGKVGLVNLGNSCFMNSALQALFCSTDFKKAILQDTLKVDSSKVMTNRLRETFSGLATPRLSIVKPSGLYRALPDWLNDGHQQDAAEFTKILFSRLEDEDQASKKALTSFQGVAMNQIKCNNCGNKSSSKEVFYDLAVPLPRSDSEHLQSLVDIYPSMEELNEENNNMYDCDHCQSLQTAKRVILSESITIKIQEGAELQGYDLYAVVIHTGESANHGHYYTYAKESTNGGQWLLYNDTSITMSSFESMQQALSTSRASTPYMLFFRKTEKYEAKDLQLKRSTSNL